MFPLGRIHRSGNKDAEARMASLTNGSPTPKELPGDFTIHILETLHSVRIEVLFAKGTTLIRGHSSGPI